MTVFDCRADGVADGVICHRARGTDRNRATIATRCDGDRRAKSSSINRRHTHCAQRQISSTRNVAIVDDGQRIVVDLVDGNGQAQAHTDVIARASSHGDRS